MSAPAALSDLPEPLPDGETIVWQGRPSRAGLLREAFHARAIAAYFVVAFLGLLGLAAVQGRPFGPTALALLPFAVGAVAVVAFAALLAWLCARSTLYTVTDRRILMRIGMALPIHLNVPFAVIEGAGLSLRPDGTGDIPLRLGGNGRIGYLHLWPHARPWHVRRPQPMLRSVPEAARVASLIAATMEQAGAPAAVGAVPARVTRPAEAARPEADLHLPPVAA